VIAFSLLLLLHIVLLQIEVGPIADFLFANFGWIPLRSSSLDDLLNWAGAGTFKPVNSDHEASAKASAHLANCKTNLATDRDFCLPGVN